MLIFFVLSTYGPNRSILMSLFKDAMAYTSDMSWRTHRTCYGVHIGHAMAYTSDMPWRTHQTCYGVHIGSPAIRMCVCVHEHRCKIMVVMALMSWFPWQSVCRREPRNTMDRIGFTFRVIHNVLIPRQRDCALDTM